MKLLKYVVRAVVLVATMLIVGNIIMWALSLLWRFIAFMGGY